MTRNVREPGPATGEALERLLAGNRRFVAGTRTFPHQASERRQELVAGQKPFAAILSCSDSRVAPEIIFDQGLGDLFVVRVAGNIVVGPLRASLEYAVQHLDVPLILVLGHSGCGAVQIALAASTLAGEAHAGASSGDVPHVDDASAGDLGALLAAIEPAVALARREAGNPAWETLLDKAVRANVRLVVSQLQVAPGVEVLGAVYDLASGAVEVL